MRFDALLSLASFFGLSYSLFIYSFAALPVVTKCDSADAEDVGFWTFAFGGFIYSVLPENGEILAVDTVSGTAASYFLAGDRSSGGQLPWLHLVATKDGSAVYGLPNSARRVLKVQVSGISEVGPFLDSDCCKWRHSVTAENGVIYAVPWLTDRVLRIDPHNDQISLLGDFDKPSTGMWGFAVSSKGRIFGIPWAATAVLQIDITTDIVKLLGQFSSIPAKWRFAEADSSGIIFALPLAASSVLRIDPSTLTVSELGKLAPEGLYKWAHGLKVSDFMFGIPDSACSALVIKFSQNEVKSLGPSDCAADLNHRWRAAVQANGAVYALPYQANSILKVRWNGFQPEVTTFGSFGHLSASFLGKWGDAVVARSGAIYGIPDSATAILKVNPFTDTVFFLGSFSPSPTKWRQGVMASNGLIYCLPGLADHILMIDPMVDSISRVSITRHSASLLTTASPGAYIPHSRGDVWHYEAPGNGYKLPATINELQHMTTLTPQVTPVQVMCFGFPCLWGFVLRDNADQLVCRAEPCTSTCCLATCHFYACPQGYDHKPNSKARACSDAFCSPKDLDMCCSVNFKHPDLLVPLLIFSFTGLVCACVQTARCQKERLNSERRFKVTYFTVLFAWDVCDQTASWWFWQYTTVVGASLAVQLGAMIASAVGTIVILIAFFAGLLLDTKELVDHSFPELLYSVGAGTADVIMLVSSFLFELEGQDEGNWIKVLNLIATMIDFALKLMQVTSVLCSRRSSSAQSDFLDAAE